LSIINDIHKEGKHLKLHRIKSSSDAKRTCIKVEVTQQLEMVSQQISLLMPI